MYDVIELHHLSLEHYLDTRIQRMFHPLVDLLINSATKFENAEELSLSNWAGESYSKILPVFKNMIPSKQINYMCMQACH